jgi:hypothetical protein
MKMLERLPWFVSAPAVLVAVVVMALVLNYALAPYFERSFLDEADPLAGVAEGAGNGAGTVVPAPTQPTDAPAASTPTVASPTAGGSTPVQDAPGVLAEGELRDGEPGHNGSGRVELIRAPGGGLVLRFEEFSVTNGPDLFVVLSPDADGYAEGSLNLGGLKATDGNINYDIPAGTDITQFESAVIWCRQFDVTFAVATLEPVP